jgi:hypothetical protein
MPIIVGTHKTCTMCCVCKPTNEFVPNKRLCRDCYKIKSLELYYKNRKHLHNKQRGRPRKIIDESIYPQTDSY